MNNTPKRPARAIPWLAVCMLVALLGAGIALGSYFVNKANKKDSDDSAQKDALADNRPLSEVIYETCTGCHPYPSPQMFPRWAWKKEIDQAYGFINEFRPGMKAPPKEVVLDYFENHAPRELPAAKFERGSPIFPVAYEMSPSPPSPVPLNKSALAISNVQVVNLFKDGQPDILACDMRAGLVMTMKPGDKSWRVLCDQIPHPARADVFDLDGDGIKDLLVANLGNFLPTDEKKGSVVWLRGSKEGTFKPITLLSEVGRVSDVKPAEFRQKGKFDLIVAVFGWNRTGEVLFLANETTDWSKPNFVPKVVDERHGAIHVPVADLNGDGKPDFVCLLAQEHERVEAFINDGEGKFHREVIYAAPDPGYGSSGIQLVDLDGDGKLDVLYTNGDVMDQPHLLKPFHGIRWLRNTGKYPYEHHLLTPMYGVHAAVAADLDGDGLLDIVATSFLPEYAFPYRKERDLDSIVVLKQTEKGKFTRYRLESKLCDHATCAVGDVFGNKQMDLVIGNFSLSPGDVPVQFRKHIVAPK